MTVQAAPTVRRNEEETQGTGIKVEGNESTSQPLHLTAGRMKGGGIFGEVSVLLCFSLVSSVFKLLS